MTMDEVATRSSARFQNSTRLVALSGGNALPTSSLAVHRKPDAVALPRESNHWRDSDPVQLSPSGRSAIVVAIRAASAPTRPIEVERGGVVLMPAKKRPAHGLIPARFRGVPSARSTGNRNHPKSQP